MESLEQENLRLNAEVNNTKTDYMKIVIAGIIALVIGFVIAKVV